MGEEQDVRMNSGRWRGSRGLSTITAAVIMIVVIVIVGAGGYFGFNSLSHGTQSNSSCVPATSPVCSASTSTLTLIVPYTSAQAYTQIPFNAQTPAGLSASSYTFNFGDGTSNTTAASGTTPASSTVSHVYKSPGTYIASVTAVANGVTYTSYNSLVIVHVVQSALEPNSANLASVAASVTANSTSTSGASAVIQATQSVTISGSYSAAPTNPAYSLATPVIIAPTGASISNPSNTSTSATATVTFPTNGTYQVVFQGISVSGAVKAYQNYTFTVVVAPTGAHYRVAPGASTPASPHKGQFIVYEYIPGGAGSEDPAIDYETAGYEVIMNVYQQLINYNGSLTGPGYENYVPDLATCVPGSPQCTKLYGNSLTNGVNYTFVLNSKARFYDPANGVSWPVYPTDVVFSVARTMAFADLPCWSCNNGWILTQSLVPLGNVGWDGGIHWKGNNTPFWVFNQVRVNDTSPGNCPTSALTNPADNGCVTFVANGLGQADWPFFLELIADPLGGSIVPAGWYSAAPQSAGIPGWTYNVAGYSGDHPVLLPGGYKTTNATFLSYVNSTMSPTSWDTWQKTGSAPPFWGNVQYPSPYTAGSGPYYSKAYSPGTSYLLAANPAYTQNPFCTWTGCKPAAGGYVSSVSVTWETSQLPGELAYQAGEADFATIPTTDTALLLNLVQQGRIGVTAYPTINIAFFPYNLNFNVAGAKAFDTSPITIPSDFFSGTAVRQFFANAYPYTTVQNTINTVDGVTYYFQQHGAIPQYMGTYYPTNVSWPSGDPANNANLNGSAAWWWVQGRTPGPYYDAELAKCSPSNPCEFPLIGQLGAPNIDETYSDWVHEISTISSGAIKVDVIDLSFIQEVIYSLFSGPYQNPMPFYTLAWAPDYPDPTDYMAPLYVQDGSYTASDTVKEQLIGNGVSNSTYTNPYWATSCPTTDNVSTPLTAPITNLINWAHTVTKNPSAPAVAQNCQGAAYSEMQWAMDVAAIELNLAERQLLYNLIEQIDSGLQLYTWYGQQNAVISYAPWINPATFDPNITLGGVDNPWFFYGGNGVF